MLRSGITVAFYTFLSRILGLAREVFIADMFGANSTADSVNVALKLPNLFRRLFAEGALASVFVPIFSSKLLESKDESERFASQVFWLLLLVLMILVGLMQYFMPSLMVIIAPGFHGNPQKFELTVLLCRITMPYLIFISIAALMGGMLNSVRKFWPFAFAPVLFNLFIIGGAIGMKGYIGAAEAISYAIILSGLAQVIFMWICTRKAGFSLGLDPRVLCDGLTHKALGSSPRETNNNKDLRKLIRLMIPATISSGALQLNIFISQSIASFIPGAVSILSYAERIYQFPLSIIGIAFGTVLLPELSRLYKSGDKIACEESQNNGIKFALFLSVPATIGLMMLSNEIINLIYERGEFKSQDTIKTAQAMAAFAMGLPAFILTKVFTPIFYANQDTKTPMKITLCALSVNTVLNILLMIPFAHVGIALGSSIAAWFNIWLLVIYAKKHEYFYLNQDTKSFVIKTIFCSLILASAIYGGKIIARDIIVIESLLSKILSLCLIISVAIIVYIVTAVFCGILSSKVIKVILKK
jgi:putative peptidoglycan lipid II flippase